MSSRVESATDGGSMAVIRCTMTSAGEGRGGRWIALLMVAACGSPSGDGGGSQSGSGTTMGTAGSGSGPGSAGASSGSSTSGVLPTTADETGTTTGIKLDVGSDTDGPIPGECDEQAPPGSFDPVVQWTFEGMGEETSALSVPLVINLTDDDGDGAIDLDDVPDIVVTLYAGDDYFGSGHIYVLDGATGALHFRIEHEVAPATHAATGDIDGDGLPEIVSFDTQGRLVAFEHDGTLAWTGDTDLLWYGGWAVALADVDVDGDVEIAFGGHLADHEGHEIFTHLDGALGIGLTTLADLDGDGAMEVIAGAKAWMATGAPYYEVPDLVTAHPQVADLDDDGLPEVLLTIGPPLSPAGVIVLEHDGTPKPTMPGCAWSWFPASIHDVDGDGEIEIVGASNSEVCVAERDLTQIWTASVMEDGFAGGTAFDFLGAGVAQAMFADNTQLYAFDDAGQALFTAPRSSVTQVEYPVVADVDADGSAEIVVVSNVSFVGMQTAPLVQVIRDVQDRWIQARRIWNQHTYHVTNVREDGTIPQMEPPSWELLNTYRTNAQIENGGVCIPDPEG